MSVVPKRQPTKRPRVLGKRSAETLWEEFEPLYLERVTWERAILDKFREEYRWCIDHEGVDPLTLDMVEEYEELARRTEEEYSSLASVLHRDFLKRMREMYKRRYGKEWELEMSAHMMQEPPRLETTGNRDIGRRMRWLHYIIRLLEIDLRDILHQYNDRNFAQLYHGIKFRGNELFDNLRRRNEKFPTGAFLFYFVY